MTEASFFPTCSAGQTSKCSPAGTPLPALPAPTGYPAPNANSQTPSPTNPQGNSIYWQQVSNALSTIHENLGERTRRRDDLSLFPKLDWQVNGSNQLTLDYNYNHFNSPGGVITYNPVSFDGTTTLPNNYVRDQAGIFNWRSAFTPMLISQFHGSYLYDEQRSNPSGLVSPSFPQIYIFSPEFITLGNPDYSLADTKEHQWEAGEGLTWIHGAHTWQFGASLDHTHIRDFYYGSFRGNYDFFNPIAFAQAGAQGGGFYTQGAGNPVFPFSFSYAGFYLQDKYHVSPRLTLNYGVREDFQRYPQPVADTLYGAYVAHLTGQFPNRYNRWAPRFGFAYQPAARTILRGGIGMFYDILDGANYENSVIANGLPSQQASIFAFLGSPSAPSFPNTLPSSAAFSGSSNISFIDPGFQTPYVIESSLELQHQFSRATTLSIGAMWTHGVHLISSSAYDYNLLPPAGATVYHVCPASAVDNSGAIDAAACNGPATIQPTLDAGLLNDGRFPNAVNPATGNPIGQLNALISPGVNNYNSGYFELQRRLAGGFSALVSYTYSKNLQTGVDFWNQFDLKHTHGPSLLDQRQRLSIAGVYQPTFRNLALKNWRLSTVMQFNSGRPYAAGINAACTSSTLNINNCDGSGDTINDSAINESTGNTNAGIAGFGSPSPVNGLDSFYGPTIQEVDLELARSFALSERVHMQFSAEAFNLLNHANFFVANGSGINQVLYTPVGAICGDGSSANQTCYLVPNNGTGGFGTRNSIDQLNGPRVFQFGLKFSF